MRRMMAGAAAMSLHAGTTVRGSTRLAPAAASSTFGTRQSFEPEGTQFPAQPAGRRQQSNSSFAYLAGAAIACASAVASASAVSASPAWSENQNRPGRATTVWTEGAANVPTLPTTKLMTREKAMAAAAAEGRPFRPAVLVAAGSYNPPTNMHLRLFELARDALVAHGYDVLGGYISPVHDGYGKKGLYPAEHRVEMCHRATASSGLVMVDNWEASQSGYQTTVNLLRRMDRALNENSKPSEPRVHIFLLCGADLMQSFLVPGVWAPEDVAEIFERFGVCCVTREGSSNGMAQNVVRMIAENDLLERNKSHIKVVDEEVPNTVSSTLVRRELEHGRSVKYLLDDRVIDYIHDKALYGAKRGKKPLLSRKF